MSHEVSVRYRFLRQASGEQASRTVYIQASLAY